MRALWRAGDRRVRPPRLLRPDALGRPGAHAPELPPDAGHLVRLRRGPARDD